MKASFLATDVCVGRYSRYLETIAISAIKNVVKKQMVTDLDLSTATLRSDRVVISQCAQGMSGKHFAPETIDSPPK